MGYDLHITRAEDWVQNDDHKISEEEWLEVVDQDPDLRLAGHGGPYFVQWSAHPDDPETWLDWSDGNIYSKNVAPERPRAMFLTIKTTRPSGTRGSEEIFSKIPRTFCRVKCLMNVSRRRLSAGKL